MKFCNTDTDNIVSGGTYKLLNIISDSSGTDDGTNVQIYTDNGTDAQ
ncbi:unnamed protein product, partial [Rotaria magnacalcarata]